MNDSMSIEQTIKEKIKEILALPTTELDNHLELGALGLDSMKSIQLIVQLEERFSLAFDDEELLFENFSTIEKITQKINERLSASA
ncbi:acyl carrier protein [Paenibacillus sp. NPDC058071]|uniref:acyl carrier protein n=1 Tax=Paenibacillus sp. NPDC058071 TaxID=3346326 RepID=UPI0036D9A90D